MEIAVTRTHRFVDYLRRGASGFTGRKSELFHSPGNTRLDVSLRLQQHTSESSRFPGGGEATGCLLLKAERHRRRRRRCVLERLLTTGLLLIHLNRCKRGGRGFVYAADPHGDMRSATLKVHTAAHEQTNTDSLSTAGERSPISADNRLSNGFKTEIYHERAATRLAGLDFASDTKGNSFSALTTEENTMTQATNPWEGLLDMFDVPRVHGSGVRVDLGNEKSYRSKRYREPGGYCPVYGKYIQLHQPTRNSKIWPNNYLVPVPLLGSPQDTQPLGGGFGLPIRDISPHTLDQLKERVRQADSLSNPDPYMMKYRREIKDNLGYCIWWTRISPAQDLTNKDPNLDLRYRFSVVWDEGEKLCTLLYVNMQEMTGAGTYCTWGDKKPLLPWYCFSSVKAVSMKDRVWTSPYTRMDHATMCPKNGLKHVHWGQWGGKECQQLAPRKRVVVKNAAECAIALFDNSPSDNPTRYVGDEGRGWDQIHSNTPGVLFPAGAVGRDQPHSRGVGVNWANYSPKLTSYNPRQANECVMYDGVPDCLTLAPGGFAFVSLASPDPEDATLPPCAATIEGAFVGGPCKCPPNRQHGWTCTNGAWKEGNKPCTCGDSGFGGRVNAWIIAGPIIGVGAMLGIATAYAISRRGRARASTHGDTIEDESREHQVQQRQTQTDLLQEAEPSFWKEATDEDPTVVLYDKDQMDQDF